MPQFGYRRFSRNQCMKRIESRRLFIQVGVGVGETRGGGGEEGGEEEGGGEGGGEGR